MAIFVCEISGRLSETQYITLLGMSYIASQLTNSKPHYELLDGLRGVAALMVIWYHVFEGFATSPTDQGFNHGYLAVDFFFILSGFVVGYAYDDRWKNKLTTKEFFKRRLIRLHPMVVLGALLGMFTFCIQGSEQWDGTKVATQALLCALILNLLLLPAVPGTAAEVRGNGEMYPLNGPNWSLFFEYIGNIMYALLLRRLSTRLLACFVGITGTGLTIFAIFNFSGFYHLGVGWSLLNYNLIGGLLRMSFSFSAGLLMSRVFKPCHIRGAFWICSLAIVILLSAPYIGESSRQPWLNGVYDILCILFLFPMLVYLGASGKATDRKTASICKFFGNISYPIYMIHYPFMYLFYAWLWEGENRIPFSQAWPIAIGIFLGSILLSYLCLKLYDEPIRRWLAQKYLNKHQ